MATVLIVDDEGVLLTMIAILVEDLGYDAVTATNGSEALAALAALPDPPAVIIADVMMPQMGGVELAQMIRQDARHKSVPIILMSAAGHPHGDHIADHFLNKPFDLDALTALIERYVVAPDHKRHSP